MSKIPCRKCSKPILINKHELCAECKKETCKLCGKNFNTRPQSNSLCGDCAHKKRGRDQTAGAGAYDDLY